MSGEALKCGKFSDFGQSVLARELKEFKVLMQSHGFPFFLIGGCCLGLIRDKAFLPHDKDIDVGIFEKVDLEQLKKVLETKYINVSISGVKHGKYMWANKVIKGALLVFEIQVHYRKDGKVFMNRDIEASALQSYTHGRIEWDEKYFEQLELISYPNGEQYWVPGHTEEYLTVQHGPWRIPVSYPDWRYHVRNLFEGWK